MFAMIHYTNPCLLYFTLLTLSKCRCINATTVLWSDFSSVDDAKMSVPFDDNIVTIYFSSRFLLWHK